MKNLYLLMLFVPVFLSAQVCDDFRDGEFLTNPAWSGDTGDFEVNSSKQLHLKSSGTDTSGLATAPVLCHQDTEWEMWIKLSFNTSLNNFARVYLAAEDSILRSDPDGYYIQLGGIADSIYIIKKSPGGVELKHRFPYGMTGRSTNVFRIKIVRRNDGYWMCSADTTGGKIFVDEGEFTDADPVAGRYMGVYCRYTSSNATKFYFDDFYAGPLRRDTLPPQIHFFEILDPVTAQITFSENVDDATALEKENYLIQSGYYHPDTIYSDPLDEQSYRLVFSQQFLPDRMDSMYIRGITDEHGNVIRDTVLNFSWHTPAAFDLVISEIMADPDPPQDLPASEFLEIFNRSQYPVNLRDFRLHYGNSQKKMPARILEPGAYIIISGDSAYKAYGETIILFTSAYSLSNEGTALSIRDPGGRVIHAVEYSAGWYGDSFKGEGGWSLEMVDPDNPCGCGVNWIPCISSSGGTPGRKNSVNQKNPDQDKPAMIRGAITGSRQFTVWFSESIDSTTICNTDNWRFHEDTLVITAIRPEAPAFKSADFEICSSFRPGVVYVLESVYPFKDCAGNESNTSQTVRFSIPDTVSPEDVVMNEILFDPYPYGVQFVEILNISGKTVDAKDMILNDTRISPTSYLLFPGEYLCLSKDASDLLEKYPQPQPDRHLTVQEFPKLAKDSGTLILAVTGSGSVLDKVSYSRDMHVSFLAGTEGVSLEKINPFVTNFQPSNWHSASSLEGYATPGRRNSQHNRFPDDPAGFEAQPPVFSPDNNGIEDVTVINISHMKAGSRIMVRVYSREGRMIRILLDNETTGSGCSVIWDGTDGYRQPVPAGNYILLLETIDIAGKKTVRKSLVTVIYPLQ